MSAFTLWNPKTRRAMGRIFVLNDSTSALARPCSMVGTIAERHSRIGPARRRNCAMRQRCAQPIQRSSAATAPGTVPATASRLVEDFALAVDFSSHEVASSHAHFIPGLATHEVQGVARSLDDVKGICAHDGPRAAFRHRTRDPGRPVGADEDDQGRSLLAEQVEEGVHGRRVRSVGRVDEPAAVVVDDHRRVAVVTSAGGLVDANARHALKEIVVVEVLDDARDDLVDRAPRAAQQSSDRRSGHLGRAPGGELLKGDRVVSSVTSPGHTRHDHTVLGARDPQNPREDQYLGASEVKCSPATLASRVIARTAISAVRASPQCLILGRSRISRSSPTSSMLSTRTLLASTPRVRANNL